MASDPRGTAPPTVRAVKGYSLPGEGSSVVISVVTVVLLLAFWWLATHLGWIRDLFLPTPEKIFSAFVSAMKGDIQGGKALPEHFMWSMIRVFSAFFLAVLTAVPVGVAMGVSRVMRGIFDPPIEFYRPLPPLAYLPLIVIWFGIGEFAKVFVIFMTAFLYVLLGSVSGVRSVPADFFRLGRNYHLSWTTMLFRVVLPSALPEIFVSLRTAMALSWAVVVASELIAAQAGLGYMIQSASQVYAINKVYVGVALIGLVGVSIDLAFLLVERRLLHWVGR